MSELRSTSPAQTQALGAALSVLVQRGDLILLVGDLGAGKTAFTQGFARALGVTGPVTSPTFTLVHTYAGRLPIHHVDVYRLDRLAEVHDLDLAELLDDGVTLIEWGEVVLPALPADYLEVRLRYPDDGEPDERLITVRTVGGSWAARSTALREALDDWLASC